MAPECTPGPALALPAFGAGGGIPGRPSKPIPGQSTAPNPSLPSRERLLLPDTFPHLAGSCWGGAFYGNSENPKDPNAPCWPSRREKRQTGGRRSSKEAQLEASRDMPVEEGQKDGRDDKSGLTSKIHRRKLPRFKHNCNFDQPRASVHCSNPGTRDFFSP